MGGSEAEWGKLLTILAYLYVHACRISWTILLVARSCICIVASYLVLVCKIQVGILKTNQVNPKTNQVIFHSGFGVQNSYLYSNLFSDWELL